MDVRVDEGMVNLSMTHGEALRLCFAVQEGYMGMSRAEYFIRTGLSQPAVEALVNALSAAADEGSARLKIDLEPGIEEIENPRRPRPPR